MIIQQMIYNMKNEPNYQEELNHPKEEDPIDYFAMVMKQKKDEKTLAVIVSILTFLSLIGTYMGVTNLIKLGTTLSYSILGIIAVTVALMIGGVIFLTLNQELNSQKRDKTLTFISANFLVFVFIGNSLGVFYLIKRGTILAYFISAVIICVVLYLAIKTVKYKMSDKG